jgi:hypothetical protein
MEPRKNTTFLTSKVVDTSLKLYNLGHIINMSCKNLPFSCVKTAVQTEQGHILREEESCEVISG